MAAFVWKTERTTRVHARMGGQERTVNSSIVALDRIAPMAVFVWKKKRTTRVHARMGGQERTVNSSSVAGLDIVTTVERVSQHQPIQTIRVTIAL
ncbi:hypothetical protein DPMN_183365 [Dreissena polymorpha]|uniref:Uncharacterized protein n=1 Tax=Dreissena polymorpha TaxID=45954 RepID=A0A9D4DHE6_DREPO|nr:hypothetical protein DPMN_183365 [Dreissena polymorpha]